jgi:2-dehydro-3-deoxyphosphogluconate aldolase / (4S)-4-hydroxy-2-oxoglutarate aldolase
LSKRDTIARLLDPGIIAIVRAKSIRSLGDVVEALYTGGVRAMELTLTTPGAIDAIRSMAVETRSRMVIGVGTVLDPDSASLAIKAGAQFVVTPVVRPEVVRVCNTADIPVACGAFTPTEALAAYESGADFVKIFPADVGGPAYIKALLGPLPQLKIIPTGGVTPETCAAFLQAGGVALGAGSCLVSEELLESQDWPKLTARAREFVDAIR